MAKEPTLILMDESMSVSTRKVKNMAEEHLLGLMEIFMSANGRMGIFTVMAN